MSEAVPCKKCHKRRVDAWLETRARNGLTAAEWPRPLAPMFADAVSLAKHDRRVHRGVIVND